MTVSSAQVLALAVAVALGLLAGLFGAAQAALARVTMPTALKLQADEHRGASSLVRLAEDPARTANILALLTMVAQVTGVTLVTWVFVGLFGDGWALAAAALAGSALLYVGAEAVPKTVALQRTEGVALALAPVVAVLSRPVAPVAGVLIRLGNVLAPGRGIAQGPFVTEEQLRAMIDVAESDEVIESTERAMIHSIFELGDKVVREIMVPRPDMVTVSADDSLGRVLDVVLQAGHSRIPVYRGGHDQIVGVLYAKDVLRRLHTGGDEEGPWGELLRQPHFVPELKPVDALLRELQTEKVHLAIVIDEYGATAGLVTIEDILEEIVGEIEDEYDSEEAFVESLDAQRWRVDARLPVDELAKLVGTELPKEEWDTVGGLLFGLLGHVASPGEQVAIDGVRLTAERVKGRRIAKVLVDRVAVEETARDD
jgi:CBS domain containing-hemolysin-like protein